MDFNKQANQYDTKAKLPISLPSAIAKGIEQFITLNEEQVLLDVGVGTGEISIEVAKLPLQYIGFDKSESMIDVFLKRYPEKDNTTQILVQNGNTKWPANDNSVDILFSSKALHLLNQDHVLNELNRIKSKNGLTLIIGSIKKDSDGIDAQMRKKMNELLTEHTGLKGKGGEKRRKQFFEHCKQQGGELLTPIVIEKWMVHHAPNDSINSWKKVDGLAGNKLDQKNKEEILQQLEDWALHKFGDLSKKVASYRTYQLSGVSF